MGVGAGLWQQTGNFQIETLECLYLAEGIVHQHERRNPSSFVAVLYATVCHLAQKITLLFIKFVKI
jgi:hypothetical protein